MKTKAILLLLLVAVLVYFLYRYQGPEGARVGDKASDFTLPGRMASVRLTDFKGKVVLLNFWATWCPPCNQEMPSLEALKKNFEGKPFQLLAVSVDEGGWPAIDQFLKRLPVTMTILLDARGDVASLYGAYSLPTSYLIDKDGRIVQTFMGPEDWMERTIVSEIEKYL